MEYEKIKQLMEDMGKYKLSSFDLELSDGTKISMKKQEEVTVQNVISTNNLQETIFEKINTNQEINENTQSKEIEIENKNQKIVKSPMVGTFYSKPSPTSNPYVEVGKNIKKGDVVCIVEAMKLMNEIESEYNGKISEVLVNDGEMVEYGTPLFIIE